MNYNVLFNESQLQEFTEIVNSISNINFSEYAPKSYKRRIEHILAINSFKSIDELTSKYKTDKSFRQNCIDSITVNTTELFRDTEVWINIKDFISEKLINKNSFNVWHTGCSTGEEVYSMLILLYEAGIIDKATIHATDINSTVIDIAIKGEYESRLMNTYKENFNKVLNTENNVIPFEKYFDTNKSKNKFKVSNLLKDKVNFKQHDLTSETCEKPMDIIFCRNVIIYFNSQLQNSVITNFHDCLEKNGTLIIGAHESIGYIPISNNFKNTSNRGFYQKKS